MLMKARQSKVRQSKAKQSKVKQGVGMHTFICSGKFKLRYRITGAIFAQVITLSGQLSCNQRSRICMFKITDRMCIFNILLHNENSPAAAMSFMHAVDDCI